MQICKLNVYNHVKINDLLSGRFICKFWYSMCVIIIVWIIKLRFILTDQIKNKKLNNNNNNSDIGYLKKKKSGTISTDHLIQQTGICWVLLPWEPLWTGAALFALMSLRYELWISSQNVIKCEQNRLNCCAGQPLSHPTFPPNQLANNLWLHFEVEMGCFQRSRETLVIRLTCLIYGPCQEHIMAERG